MRRDRKLLERLTTEMQLLLLAAGPARMDGEIAELLRTRAVDWPGLLALAQGERATAVVWRRLRPLAPAGMDAEVRASFERLAMVSDFTAAYLAQRVGETLSALNAVGLEGLLLKGAALGVSAYRSLAERPMSDIDVVVPRAEAERAFAALQQAGWRWDAAAYPRDRYKGHHHLPPLVDGRGMDVRLELHTELFVEGSPFGLEASEVYRAGTPVEIGGGRGRIPSLAHMLLHACVHYMWSHMMLVAGWRAFRDVIALSQVPAMDWPVFLDEARRHRAESACYWTLRLAERLAGASLPWEVLSRLEGATSRRWEGIFERHAVRELFPSIDRCPSQWLRRQLWELAIRPGAAGHGAARPWLLDDMAPENVAPEGREVGVLRALRQLPRVGAWARYTRSLVR